MPVDTPKWALDLLKVFFDIDESRILFFDQVKDFWMLRHVIVSEYLHRTYIFNPFMREFYRSYVPSQGEPWRKICLSRRAWERNKTHQRVFEQQEWFEAEAQRRGFEVVAPETLSIADQIRLMCETRVQIGEHGSAQHASIYSEFGMTVGTINPLGEVQINLGRLSGDRNVIIYDVESRMDENHNTFFRCDPDALMAFFDAVDAA